MADWEKYKLGDLIEFIIDNRGKTPPLVDNGYEIIETNAINGKNKYPDYSKISKFVGEDTFKTWFRKGHPKINDILISTVGDIGKVSIMNKDRGCIAQNLIAIRCKKELLNPEFLYYFLILNKTQDILKNLNIGSVQPSLKVPHLLNIDIYIPNIIEQIKLVDVLSKLDEKIILNQETNQTLEAIAQAIFKSWFVDFDPVRAKAAALNEGKSEHEANLAAMSVICGKDTSELSDTEYSTLWQIAEAFPSELVENEQFDEVPKGWEIVPLSTFGEIICGKTPTKSKAEYYGNDIPFIKIPDMHGKVFITQTIDNLSLIGANSQTKKYISKGSICVSCIATVGLVSLVSRKSQTNQQINSIVPNNLNFSEYLYLYLSQSEMNKYMKSLASGGSATLNMNTSTFSSIQILKPNNEILDLFHKKSLDIFEKILKNEENNQILAQTRDLLLPKLLSGEIHL